MDLTRRFQDKAQSINLSSSVVYGADQSVQVFLGKSENMLQVRLG